jgi:PTH1 family peptidyl-tRNA hydrolase
MPSFLVVGLGNPGAEYAQTFHNAGADAIALLAQRHGATLKHEKRERSILGRYVDGDDVVTLAFPQTYMNDSGLVMRSLVKRAELEDWAQLIVVHDELDLPLGTVRIKVGGGLAGHKGLTSITAHTKTQDYVRVRIGVGKPAGGKAHTADYVLSKVRGGAKEELGVSVQFAADAVEAVIQRGVELAMTTYNADRA